MWNTLDQLEAFERNWSGQVLNPSRGLPNSLARIKERIWDFQIMQLDWSSLIGVVKVNDEIDVEIFVFKFNEAMRTIWLCRWY